MTSRTVLAPALVAFALVALGGAAPGQAARAQVCAAQDPAAQIPVAQIPVAQIPVAPAAAAQAQAAEPAPDGRARRPRVGLVLAGGGARGAAHVGVLQVLEELHVPVDFVVGTSMGSIVGGLYAAGLAPDEIERVVRTLDWADVLDDEPDRAHLFWRRKLEEQGFLVDLEMGVGADGLELPNAVVQGQKITPLFRDLASCALGIEDFDRLRLPYRAVAMDVLTAETVVLSKGDLATAMRASMSIAGAFAPVEIDGRLLVDGGYVDNLPVDVAKSLGADVLIAVDVGTPALTDQRQLTSLLAVTMQVQDALIARGRKAALDSLGPEDVLIVPELEGVSVAAFDQAVPVMAKGRAAAEAARERLARLAVDDAGWSEYLARQRAEPLPALRVRSVKIENHSTLEDDVLAARVRVRAGDAYDADHVSEDLALLYGLGLFDLVDFRVQRSGDEVDLVYRAHEKPWGPNYLRFGLRFADDFSGNATYGVGFGLTVAPAGPRGAEWRSELELGDRFRVATTFFQPLDAARTWFVEPSVGYERRDLNLEKAGPGDLETATNRVVAGLSGGRVLGDWGEARVGLRAQEGSNDLRGEPDAEDDGHFTDVGPAAALRWDTLDDRDFPASGTIGALEGFAALESLGADSDYQRAELRASTFVSTGPWTFDAGVDLGTSFGDELPFQDQFLLGGFGRVSGLAPDSRAGSELVLVQAGVYRALGPRSALLKLPVYLGASLELGQVWPDRDAVELSELTPGGALFVGVDTPLGPLVVGFGLAEGGDRTAFLVLGRGY